MNGRPFPTLIAAAVLGSAAPSMASEPPPASEAEKIAADLANPLAPITTVFGQIRAELNNGPDDETNYQLRLQPSFFKPFAGDSAFLLRTILPVQFRNWPTEDSGLGDMTLVPYYVPDVTRSTFTGFGAALGLPTATGDALGSGQWTAGPAAIVARTGRPFTFGGLLQHIWSYAGDEDRGKVSVTTLQPFVTCLLGGGWAVTVNVESSYNWEADEAPWTVPLALGVSKVVNIGGSFFNVGVAGVSYVEKPDHAQDAEVRLSLTYVIR